MTRRLRTMLRALVVGVFVLIAVGAVSVGSAPRAGACSCATPTDTEAIAQADAAFTGSLVDVVAETEGAVFSSSDPERFVFDVETVFKGEVTGRQTVVTPRGGESCGFEISGAGPYLVFAFDDSGLTSGAEAGELYSHLCSGTRPLADGDVPVDFTSAPPVSANDTPSESRPSQESATAVEGDGGTTPWVLLVAGAGFILLVAGAIRRARTSWRSELRT